MCLPKRLPTPLISMSMVSLPSFLAAGLQRCGFLAHFSFDPRHQ
jgi:hypothetical protein